MGTPRFLSAENDVQIIPTKMKLTGIHTRAILNDLQGNKLLAWGMPCSCESLALLCNVQHKHAGPQISVIPFFPYGSKLLALLLNRWFEECPVTLFAVD